MRNATPSLEKLDLELRRSWAKVLKATGADIDKWMDRVDALLDQRLLLTEKD